MDKINEFFSNLRDRGITVAENFDGDDDEVEEHGRHTDMGDSYYNVDSLASALEDGLLYLNWGSYSDTDIDNIIIANAIIDEGQACGLLITWDGNGSSPIHLYDVPEEFIVTKLDIKN